MKLRVQHAKNKHEVEAEGSETVLDLKVGTKSIICFNETRCSRRATLLRLLCAQEKLEPLTGATPGVQKLIYKSKVKHSFAGSGRAGSVF